MTDQRDPEGNGASGKDLVAASEAVLAETVEVLHELIVQVRQGAFGKLDDLAREQRDLRRALMTAIEERQKFDKLRRNAEGADAPQAALDLAAARAEVGRRMACLRAASGADGLSGEPE